MRRSTLVSLVSAALVTGCVSYDQEYHFEGRIKNETVTCWGKDHLFDSTTGYLRTEDHSGKIITYTDLGADGNIDGLDIYIPSQGIRRHYFRGQDHSGPVIKESNKKYSEYLGVIKEYKKREALSLFNS